MKFPIQSLYTWYRNSLRNPKYRGWIIVGTILYILSPFDVLPDFLPILGEVDDVMLLTLLVSEMSQFLIEGFKARKDKTVDTKNTTPTEGSTSKADTIDVDAVSVK